VIKQLSALNGKFAIVRGKPLEEEKVRVENNLTIYSYMSRAELSDLLSQTEVVISRSGYTTLMDLAKTGHKAILCPTPGQYEQIYLADRLANLGQCIYRRQENLNLSQALEEVHHIKTIGQGSEMNQDPIERLVHLASLKVNEHSAPTFTG
jgi:predicted glycosyltransferase